MRAPKSYIELTYDGVNISQDIAPFVTGFAFNDAMSGEVDDISVDLHDVAELWLGDWLPDKGAKLRAAIVLEHWRFDGDLMRLDCGEFEIDEVTLKYPPHTVSIGAVSVPEASALRGVEKSRSWEKTTLKAVANELATAAGCTLYYDTTAEIKYDRIEQSDESDLAFLQKCCKDAGLALKVTDNQVVIFEEYKYEQAEPVAVLRNPKATTPATTVDPVITLTSWDFKSSTREIYKACHVKHTDTKTKAVIEYTYTDPNKSTGKVLQVNQQVESIAEAERLARNKLREKNKDEVTGAMTLTGDIRLSAGLTVTVEGFRKFDGKYIITKAAHKVGGGYTTSVELRRCLNGY